MMGLGNALTEAFIVENGRVITDRLAKYRIPSILQTPEIISILVEHPTAGFYIRNATDVTLREKWTLIPLIVMCFWIGLSPKPFFRILEPSIERVVRDDEVIEHAPDLVLKAGDVIVEVESEL